MFTVVMTQVWTVGWPPVPEQHLYSHLYWPSG